MTRCALIRYIPQAFCLCHSFVRLALRTGRFSTGSRCSLDSTDFLHPANFNRGNWPSHKSLSINYTTVVHKTRYTKGRREVVCLNWIESDTLARHKIPNWHLSSCFFRRLKRRCGRLVDLPNGTSFLLSGFTGINSYSTDKLCLHEGTPARLRHFKLFG